MLQLDLPTTLPTPWWRRRAFVRWVKRLATIAAGAFLGWSCPYWPVPLHPICTFLAKSIAMLQGGIQ